MQSFDAPYQFWPCYPQWPFTASDNLTVSCGTTWADMDNCDLNGSQAKQLPATIPGRCIHDWLSELTNLIKPKHLTRQKHGGNIQCYTMFRFQRFYSFMVMLRSCHVIHLPLGFHPSIQKCQVSGAPRSATCNGNPSKPVSSCTCANIDVRGVHWMRVYICIYVHVYIYIIYMCVCVNIYINSIHMYVCMYVACMHACMNEWMNYPPLVYPGGSCPGKGLNVWVVTFLTFSDH